MKSPIPNPQSELLCESSRFSLFLIDNPKERHGPLEKHIITLYQYLTNLIFNYTQKPFANHFPITSHHSP